MIDFWYWDVNGEKILLVCNDKREIQGKYSLTKLGLENISTYAELERLFPKNYNYKED